MVKKSDSTSDSVCDKSSKALVRLIDRALNQEPGLRGSGFYDVYTAELMEKLNLQLDLCF